jgi:uncharacterized protein (TIGR02145 family)
MTLPYLAAAQLKEFQVREMPRPDVAIVQANAQFPDDGLLLVYSSLEGLNFRSSMGVINKQIYNATAGRYEVLVKPLKQMIFVSAFGYMETKMTTINPTPKDVFYYKVEKQQEKLLATTEGSLTIITQPAGADVYINGLKTTTVTPFESTLISQKYHVKLRLLNYLSVDTIVEIEQGIRTVLNISLYRPKGSYQIAVEPKGADILVEGKVIGQTPLRGVMQVGTYSVEIKLDGYFSRNVKLIVQPDETTNITGTLVRNTSDICVDQKGREYKVVKFGNQIWMAENLAYKSTMDGCWAYNDDISKVETYGYLYDWETAQNACPDGWHLPSWSEWSRLLVLLGGEGEKSATQLLKKKGFNAVASGFRKTDGKFRELKRTGVWWSTSKLDSSIGEGLLLEYPGVAQKSRFPKKNGFSVRCVRD